MISAQDKILYVAQKLGLRTLKNMQASTRIVYDQITTAASNFTFFEQANTRVFPNTNISTNQFEVNEALLVESIDFFIPQTATGEQYANLGEGVKFSLIIGNKIVIKDAICEPNVTAFTTGVKSTYYFEGVGILIPPQLEYKIEASIYNQQTRVASTSRLGCMLHGTAVLTNLNTSI